MGDQLVGVVIQGLGENPAFAEANRLLGAALYYRGHYWNIKRKAFLNCKILTVKSLLSQKLYSLSVMCGTGINRLDAAVLDAIVSELESQSWVMQRI